MASIWGSVISSDRINNGPGRGHPRRGFPGPSPETASRPGFTGAVGRLRPFFVGLALLCLIPTAAGETWLSETAFLEQAFKGDPPETQALWLTGEKRAVTEQILGHAPPSIRVRYWKQGARSAWILEEIGKEKPITAGFVVEEGRLQTVDVLVYRESRGWEVRYPFFTRQFRGARLTEQNRLGRNIDNISGATLSVNALTRMARLALYYAGQVSDTAPGADRTE